MPRPRAGARAPTLLHGSRVGRFGEAGAPPLPRVAGYGGAFGRAVRPVVRIPASRMTAYG
ncbi:hypothetical protein GCM10010103_53470 [Streptomyces paradoxus]